MDSRHGSCVAGAWIGGLRHCYCIHVPSADLLCDVRPAALRQTPVTGDPKKQTQAQPTRTLQVLALCMNDAGTIQGRGMRVAVDVAKQRPARVAVQL